VLIVDASRESREVLRTLLEHRGATTIEATRPDDALELTHTFRPHLIVLDAESDRSATGNPTERLREAAGRTDTPIVILGKVRPARRMTNLVNPQETSGETAVSRDEAFPAGQILAKPYHYGALIRKIDSLLAAA
jgi:CheY-like chemotaxis protein